MAKIGKHLTESLIRSILDDKDFQNDLYPAVFKEMNLAYLRKFGQMFAETKFKLSNCETFMKYKHSPATFSSQGTDFYTVHTVKTKFIFTFALSMSLAKDIYVHILRARETK